MARYFVILSGDNIHIDRGLELPIAGFIAPRCIKARSKEMALQRIKIDLLKEWKIQFNRDNKAGTPRLNVESCQRVRNPLRRLKLAHEHYFFGSEQEKQLQLESVRQTGLGWL